MRMEKYEIEERLEQLQKTKELIKYNSWKKKSVYYMQDGIYKWTKEEQEKIDELITLINKKSDELFGWYEDINAINDVIKWLERELWKIDK